MNSNTSFLISELDFFGIRNNLKTYFQNQQRFNSYNFDGSALAFLLDVLAYNTHYEAFYVNMVASEMFLDSAQVRDNITARAKDLGYIPTSRRAAVANVQIVVTPPQGNTQATLLLPQYTVFQSEAINGINYTFVNIQSVNASKNSQSNTFTFPGVTLYQGEPLAYSFTINNTNQNSVFPIPDANVDTTTLLVSVLPTSLSTQATTYLQSSDITTANANSNIYYLQATTGGYGIQFGDGFLGRQLSNGNFVTVNYVSTDGQASNFANTFAILGSIGSFSNIAITTNALSAGGAEVETNDSIKFRAPINNTRQNRVVTINDYLEIIPGDFPNVDQIAVWGGEDNSPPVYGKVFVSMKPKAGYFITNAEKQRISDDIISQRNLVPIGIQIVDPQYLYIRILGTVYYTQGATTLSQTDLQTKVTTAIQNFTNSNLGGFNSTFRLSNLQTVVDSADPAILNSDLSLKVQYRLSPSVGNTKNYVLNFNTPLHRGSLLDKMYTFPGFTITDPSGVIQTAYIEEVPDSVTGVQEIQVTAVGSGYTVAPPITITGDGIGATAHATIQNGTINSIILDNPGSDYSIAEIVIGGPGTGAAAVAILSGRTGTARIFYLKSDGTKVIINPNIGTIDYVAGTVSLFNFNPLSIVNNPYYTAGVLTFNFESENDTIFPVMNKIIVLDTTDPLSIQLTMQAI